MPEPAKEALAADCVYHAALAHLGMVHARLGVAPGDPLCTVLPLFPSAAGETVEKQAVVETIEQLGLLCGEALVDAAGAAGSGATRCASPAHSGLVVSASRSTRSVPLGTGAATRCCATWATRT